MFKIKHYVVCSECKTPYVLRRAILTFGHEGGKLKPGTGPEWVWQRDCKHKKAPAEPRLDVT